MEQAFGSPGDKIMTGLVAAGNPSSDIVSSDIVIYYTSGVLVNFPINHLRNGRLMLHKDKL